MHLPDLIKDLGLILIVAAVVTFIFHRIRQPVVLGYILAGILLGPHMLPGMSITDIPNVKVWAELGVIFLMFNLGLEFSFRQLASLGITIGITAVIEMGLMIIFGAGASRIMGMDPTAALFVGCMVAISSTTIIAKTLEDLGLRNRRFVDRVFGILVVEDLAAILILVALTSMSSGRGASGMDLMMQAAKLVFVIGAWFVIGMFLVPRFVKTIGKTQSEEMLTVLSLGLCLLLVLFSVKLGYSSSLGAFMMGSLLAESAEADHIRKLLHPLRNLFAAIFFVTVGVMLDPSALVQSYGLILFLSGLVICGKIFGISLGSIAMGESIKDSVQTGFTMTQIGEFSFIIAGLGVATGTLTETNQAIIVGVSVLTTFTTPYFVKWGRPVADFTEAKLPEKLRLILGQYQLWVRERVASGKSGSQATRLITRWIANGIVVATLFSLGSRLLIPRVVTLIGNLWLAVASSWLVTIIVSAPFLWGMIALPRPKRSGDPSAPDIQYLPHNNALFIVRFLTVLVVGVLSLEFFTPLVAISMTAVVTGVLFLVFYRQLARSYHWFESQFLAGFEEESASKREHRLSALVPWDAALTKVRVHSNSSAVGRTLGQLGIHATFGVNIVAIQRGDLSIVAPHAFEVVYPSDILFMLGNEAQMAAATKVIATPLTTPAARVDTSGFSLRKLRVGPKSKLVGLSLKDSHLKDGYGTMLVGYERGNERVLNPDPSTHFMSGDDLWVVVSHFNARRLYDYLR